MSRYRLFSRTVSAAVFLALATLFASPNAASADPDTSEHASCPPGQARDGGGVCVIQCPADQALEQGVCTPLRPPKPPRPPSCPSGEIRDVNGVCIPDLPTQCPPGQVAINQGVCEPINPTVCPPGEVFNHGVCTPRPTQPPPCPPGEVRGSNGACMPAPPTQCPNGEVLIEGACRPRPTAQCPPGEVRTGDGRCEALNAPRVGHPGEPLPKEPVIRFEPPRGMPRPEPHEHELFRR